MAKSSKKASNVAAVENGSIAPSDGSTQADSTSKPAKQVKPKPAARKPKKTAPRAKVLDKPARVARDKNAPVRKAKPIKKEVPPEVFTDDDVRIRAYFISEHRTLRGIPGSSADDWLEARRQLQAEADRRA